VLQKYFIATALTVTTFREPNIMDLSAESETSFRKEPETSFANQL